MQEHNFDEILDFLCSGIMSKSERQSVRDELFDHLMCRYETNLAVGMDEEKATESAINDLGDKTVIKHRLSQVHSYYPKLSMKKAMNLLTVGFVLMTFQINFFDGMGDIIKLIGNVIMLVGVYCISKASKRLKQAFYVDFAGFAVSYLSVAVQPFAISDNLYVSTAFSLLGSVLNLLFWIFFSLGLNDLVKPYLPEYKKKIPIGFMGFCQSCVLGVWIILHLTAFSADKLLTDYNGEELLFVIPFIIFSAVVTLFVFRRVSKCLWQSDHEYKIEDSYGKKWVAAILAFAVAVVPIVGVDIFRATQKSHTSLHSIEDFDMPQSEYERICTNLLSYEIPEEVVYNLPKSEIKEYSRCVNKSEFSEEQLQRLDYPSQTSYINLGYRIETEVGASVCAVGMLDENGYPYVRVLSWLNYAGEGKLFDDAVFWEYHQDRLMPLNYSGQHNESFLLILSEENGKMLKNEPLDVYTDKNAVTDRMTGARFESKENLLVIHAENFWVTNPQTESMANYMFNFCHRNTALAFYYRDPSMLYKNSVTSNNAVGYNMRQAMMLISWAFSGYETEITE